VTSTEDKQVATCQYEAPVNKFYFLNQITWHIITNVSWYTLLKNFRSIDYMSAMYLREPETPAVGCQANPLTSDFIDERVAIYGKLFRLVV